MGSDTDSLNGSLGIMKMHQQDGWMASPTPGA